MSFEKYNSYKNLAYLFLAILLVVGIYQFFIGFKSKPNLERNEVSSSAYFVPPSESSLEEMLNGIVRRISGLASSEYEYGLYNEKGDLLVYLSSSKIDLNLSSGLNVEIRGKRITRKVNGYAIIDVKSVKLK